MIIFRPHRGGFAESMEEAKEFTTKEAMFDYIVELHTDPDCGPAFMPKDLVIDFRTVDDQRNGWHDTRYVCTKRYFGESYKHPQCVGMCSENYDK